MTIELRGIELYGFHGVLDDERERGQLFVVDLELELDPEVAATASESDRIEDAVDYREIAQCVRDVSEGRSFHLIEALSAAVADAILERFPVDRVRVKVRKPNLVVAGLQLGESVAICERAR